MDPAEDPDRRALPAEQPIVMAHRGPLPEGDGWAFEVCWAGERVLAASSGGVTTLSDATGADVSRWFPEVRRVGRALGMSEVIIDGVIVAADGDTARIERRLAAKSDSTIRTQSRDRPLALVAFDLLWLDGYPLTGRPWRERREALDALALSGPAWQAPAAHIGDGDAVLAATREQGLAGVVAKRVDAPYDPATVPPVWIRVDA
jgi:bifunctional non-homologous end joining protein LigD